MSLTERPELGSEDQSRTIAAPEAQAHATNAEMAETARLDVFEEIWDLQEKLRKLAARAAEFAAKRDGYLADFWAVSRGEHKEWYRKVIESGNMVAFRRVKDPDTGATMGVELYAFDPREEAAKQIRDIFRRGEQ